MQKLKQTINKKYPGNSEKQSNYMIEYKVELRYRLTKQKKNNFIWHWTSFLSCYDLNGLLSYSHLSLAWCPQSSCKWYRVENNTSTLSLFVNSDETLKRKFLFGMEVFLLDFFYYPEVESAFEVHKFINLVTFSYKVILRDNKERQI